MTGRRSTYFAYMLRLWQAEEADGLHWRASLQDVCSSERRAIVSVEALIEFLRTQTEGAQELTTEDTE